MERHLTDAIGLENLDQVAIVVIGVFGCDIDLICRRAIAGILLNIVLSTQGINKDATPVIKGIYAQELLVASAIAGAGALQTTERVAVAVCERGSVLLIDRKLV